MKTLTDTAASFVATNQAIGCQTANDGAKTAQLPLAVSISVKQETESTNDGAKATGGLPSAVSSVKPEIESTNDGAKATELPLAVPSVGKEIESTNDGAKAAGELPLAVSSVEKIEPPLAVSSIKEEIEWNELADWDPILPPVKRRRSHRRRT